MLKANAVSTNPANLILRAPSHLNPLILCPRYLLLTMNSQTSSARSRQVPFHPVTHTITKSNLRTSPLCLSAQFTLYPMSSNSLSSNSSRRTSPMASFAHLNCQLVCIAESNEWKTAFCTQFGSYEFLIMHYGLTNAPASFQQFINNIFKDMLDVCIVVYLDDILIYSRNPDDHMHHVQEVLWHLCSNDSFMKLEKCNFSIETTNFLGFIISPEGLKVDDSKTQVIQDWPVPWKIKDVQSFLGFATVIFTVSSLLDTLILLSHSPTSCARTPCGIGHLPAMLLSGSSRTHSLQPPSFTISTHPLPPIVETDPLDYTVARILSLHTDNSDVQ